MDRFEHLEWAKSRAIELIDKGEMLNAVNSMTADMKEHPELKSLHVDGMFSITVMSMALFSRGRTPSKLEMKRFILGFN